MKNVLHSDVNIGMLFNFHTILKTLRLILIVAYTIPNKV